MKKLKWGFIGCGEVTETKSGPAFNEVEGSEVVAVMSRNGKKARSYAERHGVKKWYTDAQELIDDSEVNDNHVRYNGFKFLMPIMPSINYYCKF